MTDRPMELNPPAEITAFLDHLHANGQRVAAWPLEWVRHPEKPGQWVGVVKVEDDELAPALYETVKARE